MSAPGTRLRALAVRILDRDTIERLVDPIVADIQCEYAAAIERRAPWKARLVLWCGYLGFWKAAAWFAFTRLADPRYGLARACAFSAAALLALTAIFALPPLIDVQGFWRHQRWAMLSLMLVPQALPLSIPAAGCIGVLLAMRARPLTRRNAAGVLAIGLAGSLAAWAIVEWVLPQANQAFRELLVAELTGRTVSLEPGLNEMGLSRLGRRTDPAAVRHFHILWALCFASVPLSLMALGLTAYVRRFAPAVMLAVMVSASYPAIMIVLSGLPAGSRPNWIVEAWLPNVILLVAAAGLLRRAVPRQPA